LGGRSAGYTSDAQKAWSEALALTPPAEVPLSAFVSPKGLDLSPSGERKTRLRLGKEAFYEQPKQSSLLSEARLWWMTVAASWRNVPRL
jgi:hypothetical protein